MVSLRQTLLASGPTILQATEQRENLIDGQSGSTAVYVRELRSEVKLADIDFDLHFEDESAKVKIPALIANRPEVEVKQYLDRLIPSGRIRVRRTIESVGPWCWNDVFESEDDSSRFDRVTARVTLWGDGRLNVYRAEEDTLNVAWRAAFGHFPPIELYKARESYPPVPWERLVDGLGLRDEEQAVANGWFSNASTCYSLKIKPANDSLVHGKCFVVDRGDQHFGLGH